MTTRIGLEFDFKIHNNIDEVVRDAERAFSRIGTGKGAGGQFAAASQQASQQVRHIAASQGLPDIELARGLGQLREMARKQLVGGPASFRRSSQAAGMYPSETFKLPEGFDLARVKAAQERVGDIRKNARSKADELGALSGDTEYKKATADAAQARQRIAADVQGSLASGGKYAKATADLTRARQIIAADVQTQLAQEPASYNSYRAATARLTSAREKIAADVKGLLLGDTQYQDATKRLASTRKAQTAKTQGALLGDTQFQEATQNLARIRKVQSLKTARALLDDTGYQTATKNLARTRQEQKVKTAQALLGDTGYQTATKGLARVRQQQQARTAAGLLGDTEYQTATKQLARTKQQQQAKTAQALLGDTEYQTATKALGRARQQQQAKTAAALLGDTDYQTATKALGRTRQQQQAKTAAALLGDTDYQTATKGLARTRQQQQAKTAASLLGDTDYQGAVKSLARTRQQQQAKTAQGLLGDTDYQKATRSLARTRAQQDLKTQATLLGDTDYQKATKDLARVRQVQQLKTAGALLDDSGYQTATKNLARVRLVQENKTARALFDDTGYQTATKNLARTRQQQEAKTAAALLDDTGYQNATKNLTVTRAQQSAKSAAAVLNDDTYQAATKNLAVTRAQQSAKTAGALAGDDTYRQATVDLATARKTQAARTDQKLAEDPLARAASVQAETAKNVLAAQTARTKLDDPEYMAASKAATVAKAKLAAETQQALAADPEYRAATVRAAAAKEQQAANLRSGLAADRQYIEATARLAMAREEQAARVSLARTGQEYTGTSRQELLARGALAQRTEQDLQAAATAKQATSGNRESINAAATRSFQEKQLSAQIHKAERELMRSSIKSGAAGGSPFQRLQALTSQTGKAPTEFPKLAQAAAQKTITTGGYAVGGMLAGGMLYGTIEAVKAASELQEKLAGLKGQMEAIGAGRQFVQIREEIKGVSNETGKSAAEVSTFYSRVLGLTASPAEAISETESAMKLMTVAGIDMGTMIEEVVPITKAFGISMEELGNIAVGIRDRFGVAEESILHFLGETASTMRDAGFTAEESAVVGQAAANAVGKSASVVGEQFAKVLGTIEEHQAEIINVYRRSPETMELAQPVIKAFSEGDTAGAFKAILGSYDQLDDVQRRTLVRVSGSRREWALLSGMFRNSSKLLGDLNNASTLAASGGDAMDKRFKEVSETLNRTVERVKQLFSNLVEGIFSSGVGSGLNVIGQGLEAIFKTANALIEIFNKLNEATKFGPFDNGLLMFLTTLGGAVFIAMQAFKAFTAVRAQGARVNTILTGAERALASSQGITTESTIVQSTQVGINTGVKEANLVTTEALAAANAAVPVAGVAGAATTAAAAAPGMVQTAGGLIVPAATVAAPVAGAAARGIPWTQVAAPGGTGVAKALTATGGISDDLMKFGAAAGAGTTGLGIAGKLRTLTGGAQAIGSRALFGKALATGVAPSAGAAAAGTAAGGAAMVTSGYLSTNWARDNLLKADDSLLGGVVRRAAGAPEGLDQVVEHNKKFLAAQDTATIDQLAEDHRSGVRVVIDKFNEAFFDIDLPQTLARKQKAFTQGAKGGLDIKQMGAQGVLGDFSKNIKQENIDILENWLKGSEGGEDWAKDLGFVDKEGNIDISREQLEKQLPEVLKRVEEGDEGAGHFADFIHQVVEGQSGMDDIRKKIADSLTSGSRADMDAAIEASGGVEQWLSMLYDPKGALETGQITPAQYMSTVESNIALAKETIKGSKNEDQAVKGLNAKLLEAQRYRDKLLQTEVERFVRYNQSSRTPKADEYNALLARLPKMTAQGQKDLLPAMMDKRKAKFDEELSNIQDPYELYRRTVEGYTVDPGLRSVDIQDIAGKSETAKPLLDKIVTSMGAGATMEGMLKKYADIAAEQGIELKDAILNDMKAKRDAFYAAGGMGPTQYDVLIPLIEGGGLDSILSPTAIKGDEKSAKKAEIASRQKAQESNVALARSRGVQGARAKAADEIKVAQIRLNALLEQKKNETGGVDIDADIALAQAAVNDALRASAEIAKDTTEAMMNWEVIEAQGDPVKETAAQLKIANYQAQRVLEKTGDALDPEYIAARQRVRELELQQARNLEEVANSAFELEAFDRNRDPMQAARDQIEIAWRAVTQAHGDADRNRALLSMKQAQRQLEEAQEAIFQSDAQLAITMLNIRQDPIGAAQRNVQEIERKLAAARSRGAGVAELQQIAGELAQAKSDAVDTGVSEQEDMTNYLLEMEQITQGQAIARLKVERDKYEVGTKKWRDLQLKINSMEKSAKADTQFNLPANIALPTLYEARRLNQSRAMGIGYMDNRNIALTFNVNGSQDPAAVSTEIMNALAGAAGGGQMYTPGVTVGSFN